MRELDYTVLDENTKEYKLVKQEHEMQANVLKAFNEIEVILHYEKEKGHNGLSYDDAINFLYKVLDEN